MWVVLALIESVGSCRSVRRLSDCSAAHSGDLDLRGCDYRDPVQGQTTALGGRFVLRRLLHRVDVVANPQAVERWRLASRRCSNRLNRNQRRSGHDPQPAQLRLRHQD